MTMISLVMRSHFCWAARALDRGRWRLMPLRRSAANDAVRASFGSVILAVGLCALLCAGCGKAKHQGGARTVHMHVGQTLTFTSTQLAAGTRLVCTYRKNSYSYVVPEWSVWDPGLRYGWTEQGSRSSGEGWLGIRPTERGTSLVASCQS